MRPLRLSMLASALCLAALDPVNADTLDRALVEAYLNNADLAAARANLRATDENVPQALSEYRPTVSVQPEVSTTRGETRQDAFNLQSLLDDGGGGGGGKSTTTIKNTSYGAAVVLQQNLYSGGGRSATLSRAENLVRSERANLVATEQNVLVDTANAYSQAWRFRATLAEALTNEQRLARQLQAVRDRFEVGEVARTDVAQAEARLARARADTEFSKAQVARFDASYRRITGRAPGQLDQPVKLAALPASLDEAYALAQANPEITQRTFDLAAAKDDVDVQFSSILPSLDLEGQLQYTRRPSASTDVSRTAVGSVRLTIPLYQGGAEYARVRQRRQIEAQRRHLLEGAVRSVQENVATAWDGLLSATAQVPALGAEVRANEIALEGVNQEALVGTRTVLDILDAEQELFNSRVDLIAAQADEVIASYQLKSAVGELTAAGIGLPVEPYDPVAYYSRNRNRLVGVRGRD